MFGFHPPPGIGLLFTVGDNILYYANAAARIFVRNPGSVAAVALGSYLFPRTASTVFGGVVLSRASTWIARETAFNTHYSDIANWLVGQLPGPALGRYLRTSRTLAPQRLIQNYRYSLPSASPVRVYLLNEVMITEVIAPIVEELQYRFVGQELLAQVLIALGVPRSGAYTTSFLVSNSLFTGAHSGDPTSDTFRDVLVSGTVFSVVMYFGGLPLAMLTHAGNNLVIRLGET